MQILTIKNPNFEKPFRTHLMGPKWTFWKKLFLDISPKKFGSAYAQSLLKCSNFEILAKIEGKDEFFFENLPREYKDLILVKKKFKIISCLCTFKHWQYALSK